MSSNTIDNQLKDLPLFVDSKKSTYEEYPQFRPHIGQNYESNSERTLVISEIFSTKKSIPGKDGESYCEYVLNNADNPSCVNIQQALLRHDENLTADNIAFCFFVHIETIKLGSYRSNFPPEKLDDAIKTLVPLINLLKPRKIVFLGSQTKRTVERRSGSKALKRRTLEQFLADSSIEAEVISLRAPNEKKVDDGKFIDAVYKDALKLLEDFIKESYNFLKESNGKSVAIDIKSLETHMNDLFKLDECLYRHAEATTKYLYGNPAYKSAIDDCASFISVQMNTLAKYLDCYPKYVDKFMDAEMLSEEQAYFILEGTDSLYKTLNETKMILQRLLVLVNAIKDNFIERKNVSAFSMSEKINFVKDCVKELRPKNDGDPGRVMSLQMVAKRLNENDPPITTALGKKYDSKGKGVIVLLRNVYNTLIESSSEEDRDIAAEMLHCFTKRPVVKVFVRNEDNVTEEEYWKPFKNMDAKES